MINVDTYLARIGYAGPTEPTLDTLLALHAAHRLAVAYENLDIHLGVFKPLGVAAFEDKIVRRGRGGYCFELNGLFAALLTELGYEVTLASAATYLSPQVQGNHVAVLVRLDGATWLVDLGFGPGFVLPLPAGPDTFTVFTEEPEPLAAGLVDFDGRAGFHLRTAPVTLDTFAPNHERLSTDPDSPFVRSVIVHVPTVDGDLLDLRARTLTSRNTRRTVVDQAEFESVLADLGLPVDDLDTDRLWTLARAQHEDWLATR